MPKHQITNRLRKKMNKEVRMTSSTSTAESKPLSEDTKLASQLSTPHEKAQEKKNLSLLDSFKKTIENQKKKQKSHVSKRTTPGSVQDSVPQTVHIEGKRWVKTLTKQAQFKKKMISRQMNKKTR